MIATPGRSEDEFEESWNERMDNPQHMTAQSELWQLRDDVRRLHRLVDEFVQEVQSPGGAFVLGLIEGLMKDHGLGGKQCS